jgi:hypothetical protein
MSTIVFVLAAALAAAPAKTPPAAVAPSPGPSATPGTTLDRVAAVVGDELILESEVNRLVEVQLLPRKPGENDAAYRDRVLNERIDDLLRESQLRRTGGLEPDPREVDARVQALVTRVEKERGVPFDEVLKRARMTRQELVEVMKRGLALETYVRERLSPTVKISEAELTAFYEGPFKSEAAARGLEKLPPFTDVVEEVRELVRERKLNAEIVRWTEDLRRSARILVYRR